MRPITSLAMLLLAAPALASAPAPDLVSRDYVQGRFALAENDLPVAARRFQDALKAEPDDQLRRRAMDVAMLAGDMKSVARLAQQIDVSSKEDNLAVANSLVVLARVADAAAQGDWRRYDLVRADFQEPTRTAEASPLIGPLLEAYGLSARGQHDKALALVDPVMATGMARSYFTEHQAHLLVLAGRWPEAAEAFGGMIAAEGANLPRLRVAATAAALEAARTDPVWRDRAIAWLGGGQADDPLLNQARAMLAKDPKLAGYKLGGLVTKPADGLAQLFLRVSADLGRDRASGPALSFARLATWLSPNAPEAWMVTAEILGRSDKPELALQALSRVPAKGGWAAMAESRRGSLLMREGRTEDARRLLQAAVEKPDARFADWVRLAEAERNAEAWDAAATAYGKALEKLPTGAAGAEAQIHFLRGTTRERAGQWKEAEADLRAAVTLQPENPLYQNYLGYSLLDRGGDVAEARTHIALAFKAAPENGAIIDSMGWAEYRSGNYREAVRLLEMARAAEPADPTVADHLGDALWQAGRRFEARHAWNSASTLSPEPDLAKQLARKLDYGLDMLAER